MPASSLREMWRLAQALARGETYTINSPQSPPAYEDVVASSSRQQNHRISPEKQPLKRELTKQQVQPPPQFLQNALLNQERSRLIRLPDKLLVLIMRHADMDSLLRLRHVSRDFMRLFDKRKFRQHHLTDDRSRKLALERVWATPARAYAGQKAATMGELCTSCRDFRAQKGYTLDIEPLLALPQIYCTGCQKTHRSFAFPPEQRRQSKDDSEECRLRTQRFAACRHQSHQLTHILPGTSGFRICQDLEHRSSSIAHVRSGSSLSCPFNGMPTLRFIKNKEQGLWVEMSVSTHISIPGWLTSDGQQPLFNDFQSHVLNAVNAQFPHDKPAWLPLYREDGPKKIFAPFDPNVCDCMDYGELPGMASRVQDVTTAEVGFALDLCRGEARPWREKPSVGSNDFTALMVPPTQRNGVCVGYQHSATFEERHATTHISYKWCEEDRDYLVLVQTVQVLVGELGQYVDEAGITIQNRDHHQLDPEMQHVAWCPDKACDQKHRQLMAEALRIDCASKNHRDGRKARGQADS